MRCTGAVLALVIALSVPAVRAQDDPASPSPATTPWVELEGHESYITSLAWSPDGKQLASGALDKTARMWTVADRSFKKYETDRGSGFSVAMSPDGKFGASGDFRMTIKLWSVPDGALVADLEGSTDKGYQARAVAFSRDSRTLVAGMANGDLWLYDVATKKKTGELKGHRNSIDVIAMSPDGVHMAVASMQMVKIWDLPGKKEVVRFGTDQDRLEVKSACFAPDGKTIALGSADGMVRVWDVAAAKELKTLKVGLPDVVAVDWSPDGKWIAVPGNSWDVLLIDAATLQPSSKIKDLGESARALAFSPDGKTLAIGWYYNVRLAPVSLAQPVEVKK